jgi:hypothetical protein
LNGFIVSPAILIPSFNYFHYTRKTGANCCELIVIRSSLS